MTRDEARDRIVDTMGWTSYLQPDQKGPRMTHSNIYEAMTAVMASVAGVAKRDRNTAQNFVFRGIDAVLNAIGPAMREHGVFLTSEVGAIETENTTTSKGAAMTVTRGRVIYTFHGPGDTSVSTEVYAEAFDSSDKGAAKMMSVALRIALIQTFVLPTDEIDPDHSYIERQVATVEPTGPAIANQTAIEVLRLVQEMGLTDEQFSLGIAHNTGRQAKLHDLTESEGQKVLLALQRKQQATTAAPTEEDAVAAVGRALGGATEVEQ